MPQVPAGSCQLVAGCKNSDARFSRHLNSFTTERSNQPDLGRRQLGAGGQGQRSFLQILPPPAYVLSLAALAMQSDPVASDINLFYRNNGVGILGDNCPGHNPYRRSRLHHNSTCRTRRNLADNDQLLTGRSILGAHGKSVHCRVVVTGQIVRGEQVLHQHPIRSIF